MGEAIGMGVLAFLIFAGVTLLDRGWPKFLTINIHKHYECNECKGECKKSKGESNA